MNDSWFFDKNFSGVPDDFFDDALKCFDFPLEDLESNDVGEDWNAKFQHLVPPPLAGCAYGDNSNDLKFRESRPISDASSPVSVLESSSSSSSAENRTRVAIPVKRPRSKRPRPQRRTFPSISITKHKLAEARKCTHCEVTKTPQWREGPMGPKTLCNACGVRYRSGRLFPEYRPAASPTFVPTVHSNSHRKVIEMRKMGRLSE